MRQILVVLALAVACLAQANVYFNYNAVGDRVIHPFGEASKVNVYVSLRSYLCAPSACSAGTCSHLYCPTNPDGTCQTSGAMTWAANLGNLALTFACCQDDTLANCGRAPNAGGFVTLTPTRIGSGSLSFSGPNGGCTAQQSNAWDFVATIDYSAIQSQCQRNGNSAYTGWTPVVAPGGFNNFPGGASYAVVNVLSNNNNVDPVFFNASVAFAPSTPNVLPSDVTAGAYLNGPSSGTFVTPDCGATAQILPPTTCAAYSGCSASCGCSYMTMLNRTYNADGCGTGCPTTTFLFQLCLLCNYGFSYLAVCGNKQGSTVLYGLDGGSGLSGTWTGVRGCSYQIADGGHTANAGCTAIQWAKGSCNWAQGQCDIFPVTLAGDISDYTFTFNAHAGQGQTFQVININSGQCITGTCPNGATFDLRTPSTCTCPASPTPAPPPPPPTIIGGTSAPPDTTAPPTPAPTPAPPGCPGEGICGQNCDVCCYTNAASSFQAYCVPSANGQWVHTLIPKNMAPPASAIRPNSTTSGGCKLDCNCQIQTVGCSCTGTNCICDQCTGACSHDTVCDVVVTTPPSGTCAPCPVSAGSGLECNGKGVCNCGTCVCANVQNAAGPACDQPTNGGQFTNCLECTLGGFTWCDLAGVFACMPDSECDTFFGIGTTNCDVPPESGCANNCTCEPNNRTRGVCETADGISQCRCDKGQHGADCCASGGLSKGAIAGIAGGVIAAIVIAGLVGFVIIGYGIKKGVDFVALRNQNMSAARDNPMFKPRTAEHQNPLHSSVNP